MIRHKQLIEQIHFLFDMEYKTSRVHKLDKAIESYIQRYSEQKNQKLEKARLRGFRWGVNYLAVLINNSTLISELYGWKNIVDICVEKAHKLTTKEVPANLRIELKGGNSSQD